MLHQMYGSPFGRTGKHPALKSLSRHIIVFTIALFCAPLLVGGVGYLAGKVGFEIGYIAVMGVYFGGPFYLVLGAPVLLRHLHIHGSRAGRIASLAFMVNFCFALVALVVWGLTGFSILIITAMFGFVFAPLWGATFAVIYNLLSGVYWRD